MALNMLSKSPADALNKLKAELGRRVDTLAAHRATVISPLDLPAVAAKREEDARLGALVTDAEEAVTFQEGVVARAAAEAAERADKQSHADARREAKAYERLVADIGEDMAALAAKLLKLQAHRDRIKAANAASRQRFDFIQDAETVVRTKPGYTVAEETVVEDVWRAADGSKPGAYTYDADNNYVPIHQGFTKRSERRVVSPERLEPPLTPRSLTEAVVLPGFRGNDAPIWPAR